MPRPGTKIELLDLSSKNFEKLFELLKTYSKEELNKEFPEDYMNRNVRDVLGHLHHWHLLMLDWYKIGMGGEKPEMPAKGYTWKTTPQLNQKIWEHYNKTDFADVKKQLTQSHKKVQKLIEQHTDDELFEKKRYHWTGTTSLGACLTSATSSHYDWALKLIKKCKSKSASK